MPSLTFLYVHRAGILAAQLCDPLLDMRPRNARTREWICAVFRRCRGIVPCTETTPMDTHITSKARKKLVSPLDFLDIERESNKKT